MEAVSEEKLSSFAVSVFVMPLRLARTGTSSTPLIVVVRVWLALLVPSLTLMPKLSVRVDVVPSMALSFGMYL